MDINSVFYTQASNDRPCNYGTSRKFRASKPLFSQKNVSGEAKKKFRNNLAQTPNEGIEEQTRQKKKNWGLISQPSKNWKFSATY